ncbi:MAG: UDP-N-acetylglucosamine 2-epimerase (non-hydrolyzing) [Chlorobi bacterium]|nr:UDP-N-acetylglucosamine 2-epimerase (non-hydrolyzing) [Chlorobiota bacterium]
MITLVNFIGARPQIIKAAAISRAVHNRFGRQIQEVIVHTGQHYDKQLSQVFFDEMQIPKPDFNLHVGSGPHGKQTGKILSKAEKLFKDVNPEVVVVYGDTNSTLAGALSAVKMHIPVVHIEAGMRSFNKNMPEEINRITTDHVSTLLFSPTNAGFKNLLHEGFSPENIPPYHIDNPKIYHCGDIMYDNALFFGNMAGKKKGFLERLGIIKNKFVLATLHRDLNTDNRERLNTIFSALSEIVSSEKIPLVMPLHPRTVKAIKKDLEKSLAKKIERNSLFRIIPPVSFLEMILLEKTSGIIMTDSGGVQKEAHFYHKKCLVFRDETEWIELVKNGTAMLVDADRDKILKGFRTYIKSGEAKFPAFYGDGHAAEFICNEVIENLKY